MIPSVSSWTPTSSPTDSESESHLSAASAVSVTPVGPAYSGGGGLRPTVINDLGGRYICRTLDVLSTNNLSAFLIFTVSEATLIDLESGRTTLILQPVWEGNPEVATAKLVDEVIRTKRLVLRAYNRSNVNKVEIFHNNNPRLKSAFITRVVTADLDTESEVKAYPKRVGEIVAIEKTLVTRKPKQVKHLVTELSKTFDRDIDRSKCTASTVSGIVEEQFRIHASKMQQNLSLEVIHQEAGAASQMGREIQAERQRQAEEARKQEAEAEQRKVADRLANSLYWNAQQNAYIESIQKTSQNGYYTPVTSNLSYATARSVANGIAGIK